VGGHNKVIHIQHQEIIFNVYKYLKAMAGSWANEKWLQKRVAQVCGICFSTVQQTAWMWDTKLAFQCPGKIQPHVRRRLTEMILMNTLFSEKWVISTCQERNGWHENDYGRF
jgi:hypothetical protein